MKYIFKQIDDISGHNAETTIEFSADSLPDILEHFEMFLRGSGFHPTGILDFVDEEDEYTTPKFEPAVDEDEKLDEWTQTLIDDCEWPFPKERPSEGPKEEPWHGASPSVAMQWTVKELQKGPMTVESVTNICPVCKIDNETMKNNKCWDNNCPKGNDAN
jgi:hypothetical protein